MSEQEVFLSDIDANGMLFSDSSRELIPAELEASDVSMPEAPMRVWQFLPCNGQRCNYQVIVSNFAPKYYVMEQLGKLLTALAAPRIEVTMNGEPVAVLKSNPPVFTRDDITTHDFGEYPPVYEPIIGIAKMEGEFLCNRLLPLGAMLKIKATEWMDDTRLAKSPVTFDAIVRECRESIGSGCCCIAYRSTGAFTIGAVDVPVGSAKPEPINDVDAPIIVE